MAASLPLEHTFFRTVFAAAAVYNLAWGSWVGLSPLGYFAVLGLPPPDAEGLAYFRTIGMCVLVYAPGYWWLSRHPARFCHYVLLGLLGKLLGPIGMAVCVWQGTLPARLAWTNVFNDLIWLVPFGLFALAAAERRGGWKALLHGD